MDRAASVCLGYFQLGSFHDDNTLAHLGSLLFPLLLLGLSIRTWTFCLDWPSESKTPYFIFIMYQN